MQYEARGAPPRMRPHFPAKLRTRPDAYENKKENNCKKNIYGTDKIIKKWKYRKSNQKIVFNLYIINSLYKNGSLDLIETHISDIIRCGDSVVWWLVVRDGTTMWLSVVHLVLVTEALAFNFSNIIAPFGDVVSRIMKTLSYIWWHNLNTLAVLLRLFRNT